MVIIASVLSSCAIAQSVIWPLEKLNVTGNYGEIRPNHFHAGIDFSTEGKENLPIRVIDSGYVSRIKVGPTGYGKVLYVTHPNGKVTVYGHQNHFNDRINKYVRTQQYAKQNFEVELFLNKDELPVIKGEVIGYSGNTGGSTGPHLHFEMRDVVTETPLNPLLFYKLKDTVKPVIDRIALYLDHGPFIYSVTNKKGVLHLNKDTLLWQANYLKLGVSVYDRMTINGNKNNAYEVMLFADDKLIYHHQLNNISFDDARYVNEFCDVEKNQKLQHCYVPKCYPESMYKVIENSGKINFDKTGVHSLKIIAKDEAGNSNELQFWVNVKEFKAINVPLVSPDDVNCMTGKKVNYEFLKVEIPVKGLFKDETVHIEKTASKNSLGPCYNVGDPGIKMNRPLTIGIPVSESGKKYSDKLVVMNGWSCLGGKYEDGYITAKSKNFGTFFVGIDTIAPKVKTKIALTKLKTLIKKTDHISLIITDNLSGIDKYNVFVNGKWVLAEYDAKSDMLTYFFDAETPKGKMNFKVEIKDRVGNSSELYFLLDR